MDKNTKPISEVYNMDCLAYMKSLPDKYFDLCIADPPYGIGECGAKNHSRSKLAKAQSYTPKTWDKQALPKEYFEEILRVSKKAIIWGANHFISKIPYDSSCWIVWDKENGNNDFADCELAWTNFTTSVRRFKFRWQGMLQGDMKNKETRIHPTQKPIALYSWILDSYAVRNGKIFDPFLGSGSSRIAAYKKEFDFYACELDKEYYNAQEERFKKDCFGEIKQANGEIIQQPKLF
jgi:site-specific DNA-methyltransferase (adenine-specific)